MYLSFCLLWCIVPLLLSMLCRRDCVVVVLWLCIVLFVFVCVIVYSVGVFVCAFVLFAFVSLCCSVVICVCC